MKPPRRPKSRRMAMEILKKLYMVWMMPRDEAFYYLHEQGELHRAVLAYVDDFTMEIQIF